MLAAARGIADQPLAQRVDQEIEQFQRRLANQHRAIGNLSDMVIAEERLPYDDADLPQ